MENLERLKNLELRKRPHWELTRTIVAAFRRVYECLGYGHLEIVYKRAMARELRDRGCDVIVEAVFNVGYRDEIVGRCKVDLLVNDLVVVEIKAANAIVTGHRGQLFSYLKASGKSVGLLLNFGPKPEVKRLNSPR